MNETIKQRIVEFNNQFGIKTEFITDKDVLGYALGNTIYINENVKQDYEKTNRHELLHFFEETPEFEAIKKRLLEEHTDKLDGIRSEYELRYFGLYSEEEIQAGVLDNEIVIDMMADNSSFEYEEGLKIGDDFLGQIQHSLEEKRYLNLSLTANIRSMNLSEWEKIFVLNYYDGKERKLPQGKGTEKVKAIREDIKRYLQELYELEESSMKIDIHSPEVIREHESEIKALKARGEDTSYLESNIETGYEEIAQRTSNQLYAEYKHIVDLMKGLDIETAFKSMMLRETLTKVYKLDRDKESDEGKTIVKNRKLNESIAGHMILNESTLKFIYKHIENIEEYKNFANLYFAAVEIYKETVAEKSGITLDGVDTYEKGMWLKFDGKGTDEEHYLENAKKLAALVQDTPWCTKQLASSQLADGDFYVFLDNEGKPHIAVKMNGNEIDEVRGIQNGNAQELEEEYRDVALSFLENNQDIQNGKEWLEKEEWNKRLIEYKRKIDSEEFTIEDIPMFVEDYLYTLDYKCHGGENSNRTAIKESLEKIKKVLAQYYKCSEEKIYVGDIDFAQVEMTDVPYRIIFGNVSFGGSQVTSLDQLHIIGDNVDFRDSHVRDLGQLQIIGRDSYFENSQVRDLGQLQIIGGNAYFKNSQVTDLGQLQSIGESALFSKSQVTNLGQLQRIGGNAYFLDSQVTDLGQLQSIGGDAFLYKSQITSLGQLQSIGGDAQFFKAKISSLGQLRRIGGNAEFKLSKINSLGQLQNIGGNVCFEGTYVTDLGQLQNIGGILYGAEELKHQYEMIKARKKATLSGQDVGKAGFGASVKTCDSADRFINSQLEQNIEKRGEDDEQL